MKTWCPFRSSMFIIVEHLTYRGLKTASVHYLKHYWLIINVVLCYSPKSNLTRCANEIRRLHHLTLLPHLPGSVSYHIVAECSWHKLSSPRYVSVYNHNVQQFTQAYIKSTPLSRPHHWFVIQQTRMMTLYLHFFKGNAVEKSGIWGKYNVSWQFWLARSPRSQNYLEPIWQYWNKFLCTNFIQNGRQTKLPIFLKIHISVNIRSIKVVSNYTF